MVIIMTVMCVISILFVDNTVGFLLYTSNVACMYTYQISSMIRYGHVLHCSSLSGAIPEGIPSQDSDVWSSDLVNIQLSECTYLSVYIKFFISGSIWI